LLTCFLVVFDDQSVTHSKFPTICIAYYHTTCWASWSWRLSIISYTTALTTMYKKVTSSTYFLRHLWIQIKWTRSLSCLMHHIFTKSQFIDRSRYRTDITNTLHIRIKVSLFLTRVTISLNSILSFTTYKFASFLIICIDHWLSICMSSTTIKAAVRSLALQTLSQQK
jgi:hypothetical protein